MTGLFNYRYFQESMDRELSRAERYKHSVALIMFDIDGFKAINDKYGHQFGDAVLRTIGQHISRKRLPAPGYFAGLSATRKPPGEAHGSFFRAD